MAIRIFPGPATHRIAANRRHVIHLLVNPAHTPEIHPMAEPFQLPLFPDQAALTRIRPERNESES
jgi:hypothetical protein